ncbi:AsnC family transcriptional regulator [Haladaptatus sp. F3-133]|jgi:Lrp/AsnC family leucine-responsive transcriptional regulator|uniref:AsnC family transcriptional regulator n=1 Tax=Halorutilus salinus TaxID=2487751 RepID=A0A9Q4C2D3_9EURY|nr:AsnC family transcriptional regulator [Halorutilus salinus]MCX2818038.1 AsnC family transcriptional regulator [Halorutilus salinus]
MKTTLDDTDAEILRALVEDGRKPYSEIADEVGMSSPAVIDRVDGMREKGVIEGFEARLDPSVLGTTRLVVRFGVSPSDTRSVADTLAHDGRVENVYVSADATVTVIANAEPDEASSLAEEADAEVHRIDVEVVVDERHTPTVRRPSFAPDCVECGNTVDEEGVTTRIAGDVYHFCCTSCESAFRDRYAELG